MRTDDDLATSAPTRVRAGQHPTAVVVLSARGRPPEREWIASNALAAWTSERGNVGHRRGVQQVDARVPSPFLEQGITLVDTPGRGGLGSRQSQATVGTPPLADVVLFVSDASAELTTDELDFLRAGTQLCPRTWLVVTKLDLYPASRHVVEADRRGLDRVGLDMRVSAVAAAPVGRGSVAVDGLAGALIDELDGHPRWVVKWRGRSSSCTARSLPPAWTPRAPTGPVIVLQVATPVAVVLGPLLARPREPGHGHHPIRCRAVACALPSGAVARRRDRRRPARCHDHRPPTATAPIPRCPWPACSRTARWR